jgi:hypothetical protein
MGRSSQAGRTFRDGAIEHLDYHALLEMLDNLLRLPPPAPLRAEAGRGWHWSSPGRGILRAGGVAEREAGQPSLEVLLPYVAHRALAFVTRSVRATAPFTTEVAYYPPTEACASPSRIFPEALVTNCREKALHSVL